jgi:hypothetical protein
MYRAVDIGPGRQAAATRSVSARRRGVVPSLPDKQLVRYRSRLVTESATITRIRMWSSLIESSPCSWCGT